MSITFSVSDGALGKPTTKSFEWEPTLAKLLHQPIEACSALREGDRLVD